MKNNLKRIILSIFILGIILGVFPTSTYAASASVSVSNSTVKPGDTVNITIKFSDKNIGGVQGSYSYNSNVLQYVSDTWNSEGKGKINFLGGPGTSSVSGSITFKAIKEGTAKVSFSSSEILSYDLEPLKNASTSTTITVKKPAASKPAPKPSGGSSSSSSTKPPEKKEPEKEPEPEVNPVDEALKTSLDGKDLYMWRDL